LYYFYSPLTPPLPRPPLFSYTTLFRSRPLADHPSHERLGPRARRAIRNERDDTCHPLASCANGVGHRLAESVRRSWDQIFRKWRSEEHTSELQSRFDLVCRLLLEKKKK